MTRPKGKTDDDYALERLIGEYNTHRLSLRAAGIDPDWIGVTEVKPVCCEGCGKQIPWAVLKGYQ